ncbi:hypothetical protein EZS27_002470 [termite gut metagenome]|uniref:Uncharacterized protein n=1 Tax=termite gut metagenome TaxID=433724 RepID=A0A5J4SVV2_9ZZZZ
MRTEIKYTLKILSVQFLLFPVIPILLGIAYEFDFLPVGVYADNTYMQYVFETIGVLITIACIPLALKLLSIIKKRKKEKTVLSVALKQYTYLCTVRLLLLELIVVFNIIVSYITMNSFSGFCVLMALIAFVFCIPTKKHLYAELKSK